MLNFYKISDKILHPHTQINTAQKQLEEAVEEEGSGEDCKILAEKFECGKSGHG
jgi:hypothetical protein